MRKANSRSAAIETLLGNGTNVTGDVEFTGGLHLEGRVEGNINGSDSQSRLDISEDGSVAGEIRVATVLVNGSVEGNIHAGERLILGVNARIDGDVFYHVLEMAAGAQVNGKLIYRPNAQPLALEHRSLAEGEAREGAEAGSAGGAAGD